MKKISTLKPETIFNYAGEKFVVLEQMEDGVFCLLAQSKKSVPFHDGGDAPLNDYRKSSLRHEIEEVWLPELYANGAKQEDLIPFDVDLRPTDQSEGYGTLEGVYTAPLTLWQYGRYKDFIPFNEDDWWWLVTPWACWWLRSPFTYDAYYAWYVDTDGSYDYGNCTDAFGVRPALKLNSSLLVSVDGEEDEESVDEGDCSNYSVDLGRVDTLTLIREVERRLSCGEVYGTDCEDTEEESE